MKTLKKDLTILAFAFAVSVLVFYLFLLTVNTSPLRTMCLDNHYGQYCQYRAVSY